MASKENIPVSPKSPKAPRSSGHPRPSLDGVFANLDIGTGSPKSKGKAAARKSESYVSFFSEDSSAKSSLRESFSRAWPPSFASFKLEDITSMGNDIPRPQSPSLTLRMSDLYRVHGDNWTNDTSVQDIPADVTPEFKAVSQIMSEIRHFVFSIQDRKDKLANMLIEEMARIVYGSNEKARKGLGLEETLRYCRMIFEGVEELEYSDRTEEYQERLEKLVRTGLGPSEHYVIRSRREVIQHAAAFHHIISCFVSKNEPMSEKLIKETHAILVQGINGENAGFLSSKEYGGIYRSDEVFAGSLPFPKPSKISEAMRSMIQTLDKDLKNAAKDKELDPFALAAKYADRIVNIHPFRDVNGRMCRLALNAILIKYAGIVVNVGEHDQSRDEYVLIARESTEVGGHSGALGTLVLKEATKALRNMRDKLKGKKRE